MTVAAIVIYVTQNRFSGFRVSAPDADCGTISGGVGTQRNVSGCGAASLPMDCVEGYALGFLIGTVTLGSRTLTTTLYVDGASRVTNSVTAPARAGQVLTHCT